MIGRLVEIAFILCKEKTRRKMFSQKTRLIVPDQNGSSWYATCWTGENGGRCICKVLRCQSEKGSKRAQVQEIRV